MNSGTLLLGGLAGVVCMCANSAPVQSRTQGPRKAVPEKRRATIEKDRTQTAYDFQLPAPGGGALKLSDYRGKTLLIVNLASKSSYDSQLPALQKLSETYQPQGLVVIGVPSNDFGAAEPDAEAMLIKLYREKDKVSFPLAGKSALTGVQELPFYRWLTESKSAPAGGPVHWNYTKFFIDKNGHVVARFSQEIAPDSAEFKSALEEILGGTYKPASGENSSKDSADTDEQPPS